MLLPRTFVISRIKRVYRVFSTISSLNADYVAKLEIYKHELVKEHDQLTHLINNTKTVSKESVSRWKQLQPIVDVLQELDVLLKVDLELKSMIEELKDDDAELHKIAGLEHSQSCLDREMLEEKITDYLINVDQEPSKSVSIELLAGAGGLEAGLFASDLVKMYRQLSLENDLLFEIVECHLMSHEHGSSETVLTQSVPVGRAKISIEDLNDTGLVDQLRHEGGVHRVQRIPVTSKLNKIHTSTVAVVVLPLDKDCSLNEIQLDKNDLRWDVFHASGPGGQHLNVTDSAVRLTHLPSGMVVVCQKERSLEANKSVALKTLKERIQNQIISSKNEQISKDRKLQAGSLERSDKIRTYNFPQDRVTDHRVGKSWIGIDRFMGRDSCTNLSEALQLLSSLSRRLRLQAVLDQRM